MGNSAPGSGGWFFAEEAGLVLLRLHDLRGAGLAPGEEASGLVGGGDGALAFVRRDEPATIPVGAGAPLTVEFQAHVGRDVGSCRSLGGVVLPLEHIARRCGGSLYYMWLPLDATQQSAQGGAQLSQSSEAHTLEQFDRDLRSAARDPRLPLVCLSLCQADSQQAQRERYELNADASEKGLRFYSLLQSHAQHSRLLQALYRQSRSVRSANSETDRTAQMLPQLRDALVDSWASLAHMRSSQASSRHEGFHPEAQAPEGGAEGQSRGSGGAPGAEAADAPRLRLDIETTTREANARINQASDAIRTLKERVGAKQAEHERLARDLARARREAAALEGENEELRLRLERRARGAGRGEEARRLRREAGVLAEQKEALVLILEDLYGAVGPRPPPGAAAAPEAPGAGEGGEAWTNLLPRPSELFASGALEDRA